ncbi:ABC transporter permease [bacterium]|nr:ABC transporter permease [bacterium]
MFNNYLKIALRNLLRHKSFSVINLLGFAIGMTCAILILLWVSDEVGFDRFHKNADTIYRVVIVTPSSSGILRSAQAPNALGPALKECYPEIIDFTRYMGGYSGWLIRYGERSFSNDRWAAADPSFFTLFSFPFVHGNPKTVFENRYSVVITEKMAKKYFGDENPIGKILTKDKTDLEVTGIIKIPQNSHIQFDYIFPVVNMKEWFIQDLQSWEQGPIKTYIQLSKAVSAKKINNKITGIIEEYHAQSKSTIQLQPLKKIHLYTDFQDDACNYKQGNAIYVFIFLSIAVCVLLIACFNYMNLSTARSAQRAKEVGVRKVIGAKKTNIILQFWGEAFLLTIIALLIALVFTDLLLPLFNHLSEKQLSLNIAVNFKLWGGLVLLAIITGVIAGSYPALYLSSMHPLAVIQISARSGKIGHVHLRKILVIMQFTITIFLIIASLAIYHQLSFMKNKDLGYDHKNIIYFYGYGKFSNNYESIRSELLNHPNILGVSKSFAPFFPETDQSSDVDWEGRTVDSEIVLHHNVIDYDYLHTFKLTMVEGSFFSRDLTSDLPQFVMNETAVKSLEIKNPVGKRFTYKGQTGSIVGVIKDFHNKSLHNKIAPFIYSLYHGPCYINIKMGSADIQTTLKYIGKKYNEYMPGRPFSYHFLDTNINNYYRTEQKLGRIIKYFSGLTVFISCLGLLGLASFNSMQRTSEIGIRKVLGASVFSIIFMLSKDFSKWVIIANFIAWPIAYYFMKKWLQNFAYRIDLTIWPFILAGGAALIIALLTVSWQTIRAATANPVESLRYE